MNLVRGGASSSPASLFAAAEPGAWYDPSDLTTLFQNGTSNPVTSAGQSVGVMLDKSQGLALGSELVSNGGFDSATGWTLGTGWSIAGGVAVATASTSAQTVNKTLTTLVTGQAYSCSFTLVSCSAGAFSIKIGTQIGQSYNTPGTYSYVFVYNGAGQNVSIRSTGLTTGSVDNFSIKLVAGNHASQTTLAQCPTYQVDGTGRPYLSFDGVDDNLVISSIALTGAEPLFFCFGAQRLSTTSVTALTSFGKGGATIVYPGYVLSVRGSSSPTYAPQLQTSSATVANNFIGAANTFGDAATCVVSATRTALRVNASGIATTGATGDFDGWVTQNNRLGCNYNFSNTNFWKGGIYSAIFVASAVTAGQITSTENWVNGKTGAY